jgi:hypothetical protein
VLNEVQQRLFVDRYSQQSGLSQSRDLQGKPLVRYKDTGRYMSALDILRQGDIDDAKLVGNTVAQGLQLYRGSSTTSGTSTSRRSWSTRCGCSARTRRFGSGSRRVFDTSSSTSTRT